MNIYSDDGFKVGWCPICNQGWATIQKNTIANRLFIQCEECMSAWKDPENFKTPNTATFGGVIQVKHTQDTSFPLIETPTYEEIKTYAWEKFLVESD